MQPSPYILDVREPHEFAAGNVAGSRNVPLGQLQSLPSIHPDILPGDAVVAYCRSGGRAGLACQILASLGYTNVTNGINQSTVEAEHI